MALEPGPYIVIPDFSGIVEEAMEAVARGVPARDAFRAAVCRRVSASIADLIEKREPAQTPEPADELDRLYERGRLVKCPERCFGGNPCGLGAGHKTWVCICNVSGCVCRRQK